MAGECREESGWRVVEGPGTEDTAGPEGPEERDLGKPPVPGAGYGASTGGVGGEPGMPGPAPGEIPEHTGPLPIGGERGSYTPEDSYRDDIP